MSKAFIALVFALGVSGWVYNKSMRQTGGLTQRSLTAAGVVGAIAFIVFLTIFVTVVPD